MINKENYLQNIPQELRQYKQWLWFKRIVRVDKWGKEKISKILNRKVVASSWQVLYDKYVTEDLYFKDKVSKYIFYLVEIEGKPQLDFLGITYEYYSNKKVAEKWHKEMVKLIHPGRCKHPKATEAMQALEKLYKGMI